MATAAAFDPAVTDKPAQAGLSHFGRQAAADFL
jgi:hypothetical protein